MKFDKKVNENDSHIDQDGSSELKSCLDLKRQLTLELEKIAKDIYLEDVSIEILTGLEQYGKLVGQYTMKAKLYEVEIILMGPESDCKSSIKHKDKTGKEIRGTYFFHASKKDWQVEVWEENERAKHSIAMKNCN